MSADRVLPLDTFPGQPDCEYVREQFTKVTLKSSYKTSKKAGETLEGKVPAQGTSKDDLQ
jgi:hypothetical protein